MKSLRISIKQENKKFEFSHNQTTITAFSKATKVSWSELT